MANLNSTTSAKIKEIKSKGVFHSNGNGAELYTLVGTWNKAAKRRDIHWYMISEKTGIHMIITQNNRMDQRVEAHWDGFKKMQNQ